MIATAVEPIERAAATDPVRVRALLRDAASWWSAKARLEPLAVDRLWVLFECSACTRTFDRVFRLPPTPWAADEGAPPYLLLAELPTLVGGVLDARPLSIEAAEWRHANECECRAPQHHRRAVAAALFHTVPGSGAGLVVCVTMQREVAWLRLPDGGAVLEAFEGSVEGFRRAFEAPFTTFDAWADLAAALPVSSGSVTGRLAEPGVFLFAASSEAELSAGIASKLASAERIVVRLDARTVRSRAWPAVLLPIAEALENDGALALVVERDIVLAQTRAWARSRASANVRREERGELVLGTERGDWPLSASRIALAMVQRGRTLAEACAHEVAIANDALDDRIATLVALAELVPRSPFAVHGRRAPARLPDGRVGQTLDLVEIPAGAGALAREVLAREAAFFFDVAPPWADRTRVCACGAAASLERRLLAWPWRGDEAQRPWVVGVWGDAGAPRAAEVVAIACDRHVRVLAESELRARGVDEATLARRLDADLASSVQRVQASVWVGPAGGNVIVARGPLAAGVMLSDGRARALDEALGGAIGASPALGLAVGSDVVVLAELRDDADDLVQAALRDASVAGPAPFWIRRELDLAASPLGSFDVIVERLH